MLHSELQDTRSLPLWHQTLPCFLFVLFLVKDQGCISITEAPACSKHLLLFSCEKWFIVMFDSACVCVVSMTSKILYSCNSVVFENPSLLNALLNPCVTSSLPTGNQTTSLEGFEISKALVKQIVRSFIRLLVTCDHSWFCPLGNNRWHSCCKGESKTWSSYSECTDNLK